MSMAQFYSALTIVIHLYTTASLRIGTDSPRCTCHFFLAFLISYKCLILKNRKKGRNTVSQIAMCPDLQTAKGQAPHRRRVTEQAPGKAGESWKVSRHHLLIPGEGD